MSKHTIIYSTLSILILALAIGLYWSNTRNQDHFVVTMERYLCEGYCPAYRLTIYSDGTVYYTGYSSVKQEGDAVTKLNPAQVKLLLHEIEQSKIFDENYGCCYSMVKDAAFVELKVILNGEMTFASYPITSSYYVPPNELRHLECAIDKIVNSDQWVGTNRLCKNVLE